MRLEDLKPEIKTLQESFKTTQSATKTLDNINSLLEKLDAESDKITFLKYCFKKNRHIQEVFSEVSALLAKFFFIVSNDEDNEFLKLLLERWAVRYTLTLNTQKRLEDHLFLKLGAITTKSERLEALLFLDGLFDISRNTVLISCTDGILRWNFTPLCFVTESKISNPNSQEFKFSFDSDKFGLAGITSRFAKEKNADNIGFARLSNGETLLLLADGTSGSSDPFISSRIAIEGFIWAYQVTLDAKYAVKFANTVVRNNNLKSKLDGETTLSVIRLSANLNVDVIVIGDSCCFLNDADNIIVAENGILSDRYVLGIEPMGDMLTSSVNVVRNLVKIPNIEVKNYFSIQGFVMASDGISMKDHSTLDFVGKIILNKDPERINTMIMSGCEAALNKNNLKPDNISIISGHLKSFK